MTKADLNFCIDFSVSGTFVQLPVLKRHTTLFFLDKATYYLVYLFDLIMFYFMVAAIGFMPYRKTYKLFK
jgi:hypothetical protein